MISLITGIVRNSSCPYKLLLRRIANRRPGIYLLIKNYTLIEFYRAKVTFIIMGLDDINQLNMGMKTMLRHDI
jgi:hypothetical protein